MESQVVLRFKELNKCQLLIKVIKNNIVIYNKNINTEDLINLKYITFSNCSYSQILKLENRIVIGIKDSYILANFNDYTDLSNFKNNLKQIIKDVNEYCGESFDENNDGFEIIK